jgi:NAD-dependent dihydropyrimidine dehydrogenase PreA subunit
VCPVDSIDLYEARIVIKDHCIDCMLCVWICPVETLAPLEEINGVECETVMIA